MKVRRYDPVMRMSPVVVICAADELSTLQAEPGFGEGVRLFADTDAVRASQAIASEKPRVVVLERRFAGTARGAALVNAIQTDDSLSACQIRVLSRASDYAQLVTRRTSKGSASATAVPGDPLPPDYLGSRQSRRYRLAARVKARLGGAPTTLIDLSDGGAQVVGTKVLRPNQLAQLEISCDADVVGGAACVVWAFFEPMGTGAPRYRAGLQFVDADPELVEVLCWFHERDEGTEAEVRFG